MSPFPVVTALSVLTIIGQLIALTLLVLLIWKRGTPTAVSRFLNSYGTTLMCIVALTATTGSLFFSEIAGWTPCKLCWFQRIFMYPQVILLGIALWQRDKKIASYILVMSLTGIVIAAAHYNEQVQLALHPIPPDLQKPCDTSGVSCAHTPIFAFGYITIPLMAFTAFVLNSLGSSFLLLSQKRA